MPDAFQGPSYNQANDFAVIWVPALSVASFPPIGLLMTQSPQQVRLVGYPVEGPCAGTRQPWHATFTATPSGLDSDAYPQTTYEGMSGGPLIVVQSNSLASCGVHVQGTGPARAVRVSANMASQLLQRVK